MEIVRSLQNARQNIQASRVPTRTYDPLTGQVFSEIIVEAEKPKRQSPKLTLRKRKHIRSPKGAFTLTELSIQVILREFLGQLDAEVLSALPWHVAKKILHQIEDEDRLTGTLWKAFAATYQGKRELSYYHSADTRLLHPLSKYISKLNSDNLHWLTCLTISKVTISTASMMQLSELRNLAALNLTSSPRNDTDGDLLDDYKLRTWCRFARESGRFHCLRALILQNQPGITNQALTYLNMFPHLVLFGVRGTSINVANLTNANQEIAEGWTREEIDNTILHPLYKRVGSSQGWDSGIRACLEWTSTLISDQDASTDPKKAYLLNFRIGRTLGEHGSSSMAMYFRHCAYSPPREYSTLSLKRRAEEQPHETENPAQNVEETESQKSYQHSRKRRLLKTPMGSNIFDDML